MRSNISIYVLLVSIATMLTWIYTKILDKRCTSISVINLNACDQIKYKYNTKTYTVSLYMNLALIGLFLMSIIRTMLLDEEKILISIILSFFTLCTFLMIHKLYKLKQIKSKLYIGDIGLIYLYKMIRYEDILYHAIIEEGLEYKLHLNTKYKPYSYLFVIEESIDKNIDVIRLELDKKIRSSME